MPPRRWPAAEPGCAQPVLTQAVKRSDFVGQRAQRCHLDIAIVRHLRHLLVVFAERLPLLAHLVVALGFEQHPCVGAGQPDDGKRAYQRGGHKSVGVLQRQRNLANPPVLIACNK